MATEGSNSKPNSGATPDCTPTADENARLFTREEALECIQHGITEAVRKMEKIFEEKMTKINKRLTDAESATKCLDEQLQSFNMDFELHRAKTEQTIKMLEGKVDVLQHQALAQKARADACERANNDLEQYSRRSHVRIHGLVLQQGESCKAAVARLCSTRLNVPVKEEDMDAAHPLPSTSTSPKSPTHTSANSARRPIRPSPATIIVRFHRRDLRDTIIAKRSKLKASGIVITEDLTQRNQRLLTKLHHDPNIERSWSWMGKILAIPKGSKRAVQIHLHTPFPTQRSSANNNTREEVSAVSD